MRMIRYWDDWYIDDRPAIPKDQMLLLPRKIEASSQTISDIIFTEKILEGEGLYTHTTHTIHSMPETVAHRILRSSKKTAIQILKASIFKY